MCRPGDCFVSFDLSDGYCATGIIEEDRHYFTVNYRGDVWRLACLPMSWSGSFYYFFKLAHMFTNYPCRPTNPTPTSTHAMRRPSSRFLRNTR
jgi:hypothetical protein